MQIELIHLDGKWRGKTEIRPEKRLVLGSGVATDLRYEPDGAVEPQHAEIHYHEDGCSFHIAARDGRVFVNDHEVHEIILTHGDLIEFGVGGPKIRFHIHAEAGEVCKPIRQMIHDAGLVREQRGIIRATTSFGRDIVFRSSWRFRIVTPIVMAILIFAAAFFGGHLASSRAAREAERSRRDDEEGRLREIGALRDYIAELELRQRELVGRDEIDRIRGEVDRQRELVDAALADDRALSEILERYSASVCLIHGIYGFRYEKDGTIVEASRPGGDPLEIEYTGSGFLVRADGRVVTNRHVAEPWWENQEVARFVRGGFKPYFRRLHVFFPGKAGVAVDPATIAISKEGVDLAVLTAKVEGVPVAPIEEEPLETFRGRRVVLLGYPTGVGALLARSERADLEEIFKSATDLTSLISELSKRGAISPIITQGALNEVKEKRLVYDAATTSGGSGGPVFGPSGKVIGVNFAITRNFDGSNFGVPIGFVRGLLQP